MEPDNNRKLKPDPGPWKPGREHVQVEAILSPEQKSRLWIQNIDLKWILNDGNQGLSITLSFFEYLKTRRDFSLRRVERSRPRPDGFRAGKSPRPRGRLGVRDSPEGNDALAALGPAEAAFDLAEVGQGQSCRHGLCLLLRIRPGIIVLFLFWFHEFFDSLLQNAKKYLKMNREVEQVRNSRR